METTNFKQIKENAARLIDEAGFAAYNAVGTDGFLRAFTRLLEVFKKEYAAYLYADAGIDLYRVDLSEEDSKYADRVEEITSLFAAGLEVLTPKLVERFDPERATKKPYFFSFLKWNTEKRSESETKRENIADFRHGISGMTKHEEQVLSAALSRLQSVTDVTDDKLREIADIIGCDYETLLSAVLHNNAAVAESLDTLFDDGEEESSSLYDRVAANDGEDYAKRAEELEGRLSLLDSLLSYSRPLDMKKKDAPPYELSRTEKERYPIIFTNALILGWVDELRDSDPDCKNRDNVFSRRFKELSLPFRLAAYEKHLSISKEIFELYITHRREFTAKELGELLQFDSTSLPGIADSVAKKLQLFLTAQ